MAALEVDGRAALVTGAAGGIGLETARALHARGAYEDPIAARIEGVAPRPLRKRITPEEAGEALAAGIERRAPRTIRPRRWAAYSRLRGLLNPTLDRASARHRVVQAALAEGRSQGGD